MWTFLINAGASWGAPAEDHPTAAWDKVMNLNVRGYFLLSQQIARLSMLERKSGRIINLASIAGLGGNPSGMKTIAYNTSKGAVINFTRAGRRVGRARHHRQRHLPGLFQDQDGGRADRDAGRGRNALPCPAAPPG
jgi:NAD(P)-dependent dehydrogenase (short-subunit alcohol dehydrogenase family)